MCRNCNVKSFSFFFSVSRSLLQRSNVITNFIYHWRRGESVSALLLQCPSNNFPNNWLTFRLIFVMRTRCYLKTRSNSWPFFFLFTLSLSGNMLLLSGEHWDHSCNLKSLCFVIIFMGAACCILNLKPGEKMFQSHFLILNLHVFSLQCALLALQSYYLLLCLRSLKKMQPIANQNLEGSVETNAVVRSNGVKVSFIPTIFMESAVALWLVRWTPDRAVLSVNLWPGSLCCVLGQDTLLS